jgi:hypothetical protein
MSFLGAVIAGLVATLIFWVTTRLSTMNLMGMERYLGTMFTESKNERLGFVLLFVGGVLFGLIYAALWSADIGWIGYRFGLLFGIVQWLIVGLFVGFLPAVHVGIRVGSVPAPGLYMTNLLGGGAFLAGLANHMIFGLAFAYFYQFFITRYG